MPPRRKSSSNKKKPSGSDDTMQVAGLMAHQLKSPISAAASLLKAVLGEHAGPLTPQQKRMLQRTDDCIEESMKAMRRMLDIIQPSGPESARHAITDVAGSLHAAEMGLRQETKPRQIELSIQFHVQPAYVRAPRAALEEVFSALVSNAIKYTPDHGKIAVEVASSEKPDFITLSVSDSGIGIPEKNREKIFEPFFRTNRARTSDRPGVGLGLAFVKSVVGKCGGQIRIKDSALGGARFDLELPRAPAQEWEHQEAERAENRFHVVIVGGVAAGPKAAAKIIRLMPNAEVTIIEKGKFLSYAGCGLPYYVAGNVQEQQELMCTALGTVRDPVFFQKVKNVHVRSLTEAVEIDRQGKRVLTRDCVSGDESWVSYDKLFLATGALPLVPALPGVEKDGVFTLHGVQDAEGIKAALAHGRARDVMIIGGGLVGVEMTEALVSRGCRVTIAELEPQVLHMLDWEMAHLVEKRMESRGVRVLTQCRVLSIEGRPDAPDRVGSVITEKGEVPVDVVILAVGVQPNVELARKAKLRISRQTGAIKVNEHMRTSDPDIYAGGDCVECRHIVTDQPCWFPLGSTANKQGRVAAINICGGDRTFPGVVGSTVCKVFDCNVGRTGLTETEAEELGYDVETVIAPAPDRAHYMPDARLIIVKLVVDSKKGRLLGAQIVGPGDVAKRVDVAAMAITARMTIYDLANADLCYAPPYAPVMDNIITAANVAQNKLSGDMVGITARDLHALLEKGEDILLLDLRTPHEYEQERIPNSTLIPLASLRARLHELPRNKRIVTFCNISLRGYEGALILRAAGFKDVQVLDGGIAVWPYEKEH